MKLSCRMITIILLIMIAKSINAAGGESDHRLIWPSSALCLINGFLKHFSNTAHLSSPAKPLLVQSPLSEHRHVTLRLVAGYAHIKWRPFWNCKIELWFLNNGRRNFCRQMIRCHIESRFSRSRSLIPTAPLYLSKQCPF